MPAKYRSTVPYYGPSVRCKTMCKTKARVVTQGGVVAAALPGTRHNAGGSAGRNFRRHARGSCRTCARRAPRDSSWQRLPMRRVSSTLPERRCSKAHHLWLVHLSVNLWARHKTDTGPWSQYACTPVIHHVHERGSVASGAQRHPQPTTEDSVNIH